MRKQELIIFIGVIILVAIMFLAYMIIAVFTPSQSPSPSLSPLASPSFAKPFSSIPIQSPPPTVLLPSSLPQPIAGSSKQSLVNQLPIQTDFANIEYLSVSDSFAITIKANPYKENRVKVEKWFQDQGFNPTELNIYWQTYPEVITE